MPLTTTGAERSVGNLITLLSGFTESHNIIEFHYRIQPNFICVLAIDLTSLRGSADVLKSVRNKQLCKFLAFWEGSACAICW